MNFVRDVDKLSWNILVSAPEEIYPWHGKRARIIQIFYHRRQKHAKHEMC